jgi:GNAT superfamily N-acetyltransferase
VNIVLTKATLDDAEKIHCMQLLSFKPLLDKYRDYDISPGAEPLQKVVDRLGQSFTRYYLIEADSLPVGAIRVVLLDEGNRCRISPVFIIPEYQNKGIAQSVFSLIETMYHPIRGWALETILEEKGNCHLYEKLGYEKTGRYERINERMTIVYYEKVARNQAAVRRAPDPAVG